MIACRYFDGTSSRARAATIAVDIDVAGVRVKADDVDRHVALNALRFVPSTDLGPARIVFADGGLCEIDDRRAADGLFGTLGHRPAASDRLVARTWQVLAVTVAFVMLLAVLYRWAIPWGADRLVEHMPLAWDEALGAQVLETMDRRRLFRPSDLPADVRERIVRRFAALRLPADGVRVRIVFRKLGVPNALALPGGVVVVADEIVAVADGDDDALATVLAHEAGHVAHRDALRQLARSTVTSGLAAWYFGDVSNAAAIAAGSLGSLSYSRDAEHQADLFAVRTMRANGVSTAGAGRLFRRLQGWTPASGKRPERGAPPRDPAVAAKKAGPAKETADGSDSGRAALRFPEYLSTHPDTDGRIRLFESDGASDPDTR